MTLFTSRKSALLAAAKAKRDNKCADCRIHWACCICGDRSVDGGFKVTLLNTYGHPIGCL